MGTPTSREDIVPAVPHSVSLFSPLFGLIFLQHFLSLNVLDVFCICLLSHQRLCFIPIELNLQNLDYARYIPVTQNTASE